MSFKLNKISEIPQITLKLSAICDIHKAICCRFQLLEEVWERTVFRDLRKAGVFREMEDRCTKIAGNIHPLDRRIEHKSDSVISGTVLIIPCQNFKVSVFHKSRFEIRKKQSRVLSPFCKVIFIKHDLLLSGIWSSFVLWQSRSIFSKKTFQA